MNSGARFLIFVGVILIIAGVFITVIWLLADALSERNASMNKPGPTFTSNTPKRSECIENPALSPRSMDVCWSNPQYGCITLLPGQSVCSLSDEFRDMKRMPHNDR